MKVTYTAAVIAATIVALLLFVSTGTLQLTPPKEIVVKGGEVLLDGPYGFGLKDGNLTSPGPLIRLKKGESVKITLKVEGKIPHTFNVVREANESETSIWGAEIGTPLKPVIPGETRSVTFTPQEVGDFYYVCLVPGHISAFKMFGKIEVQP